MNNFLSKGYFSKFNSPVHWPRRWRRLCRLPPRGEMSCPCTVRAHPPSCERTAEKITHGLVILPHAVEQTVEGAPVGACWRRLDSHLHCVQRITSQHSSCSWTKIYFVSLFVATNVLTSHTTSHKLKSHCLCLCSGWFVINLLVLFFKV